MSSLQSHWDTGRLRTAADAGGVALWSWNVATDEIELDGRAHELWAIPVGAPVTFEDLSSRIHPVDLTRVRRELEAAQSVPGQYEIDFRVMIDDKVRWISARGCGGGEGMVGSVLFAIFLDVTQRKEDEDVREMLVQEMSHRIKNLFSVTSALTVISARSTDTKAEMTRDLTSRLIALGKAHDLVRPTDGKEQRSASLESVLSSLLAPYAENEAGMKRVTTSVPDVEVKQTAITSLALVVHELATNSIKYGALSAPDGAIDVYGRDQGMEIEIVWTERGGPPIHASTRPHGFGSKLIHKSMTRQLGGSIALDWQTSGVVVTMRMNRNRLSS